MRIRQSDIKRALVVGTSCSGKTTFANALAEAAGINHVELDALFWQENWKPQPKEVFVGKVASAVSRDAWIIDGNFSEVQELILERATMIVWLNYGFFTVFFRALKRSCRRILKREELYSNNREFFWRTFFSRNSILYWIITTFCRRRRQYRKLFTDGPGNIAVYVEFTHPEQAQEYLESLELL